MPRAPPAHTALRTACEGPALRARAAETVRGSRMKRARGLARRAATAPWARRATAWRAARRLRTARKARAQPQPLRQASTRCRRTRPSWASAAAAAARFKAPRCRAPPAATAPATAPRNCAPAAPLAARWDCKRPTAVASAAPGFTARLAARRPRRWHAAIRGLPPNRPTCIARKAAGSHCRLGKDFTRCARGHARWGVRRTRTTA